MNKQEKLKKMWLDIPSMNKEQLMKELSILKAGISYEEIVERLKRTYDDLLVADYIFETYPIDDSESMYPKEFIDEAITKIARNEHFDFLHYGILSQDLSQLRETMTSEETRNKKRKELFSAFFHLCKKFNLDNFDALLYSVNDQVDLGKELLHYLHSLQKSTQKEDMHEILQITQRFLQQFDEVNPYLYEQLHYIQASSYIALKSSKGEKMFLRMIKEYPDTTDVIYHYALAYESIDPKRMASVLKKYEREIHSESESYASIQILKKKIANHE